MLLITKKLDQSDLNFNLLLQQLPLLAFQSSRANIGQPLQAALSHQTGQQGLLQPPQFQPQILQRTVSPLQAAY